MVRAGLVIGGAVLVFLGLLSLGVVGLGAGAGIGGGDSSSEYEVVCSGTVEVDAFGIGSPELDPAPSCYARECSSGFFSFLGSEGQVTLVVDGVATGAVSYDSTLGENVDYTVVSDKCFADPSVATVILYEDGQEVDRKEVNV